MNAEMRFPAEPAQVRLCRVVASSIALREEFDVDTVADLEMLVDGACALLIAISRRDATLHCRFLWSAEAITVHVSTAAQGDVDVDSLDWHLLSTLADRVHRWRAADSPAEPVCHIELTMGKRAGESRGSA